MHLRYFNGSYDAAAAAANDYDDKNNNSNNNKANIYFGDKVAV